MRWHPSHPPNRQFRTGYHFSEMAERPLGNQGEQLNYALSLTAHRKRMGGGTTSAIQKSSITRLSEPVKSCLGLSCGRCRATGLNQIVDLRHSIPEAVSILATLELIGYP